MNSSRQVIVSLSSFGAAETRRHGQGWFIRLCQAAGADGVEVRGELLQGREGELAELASVVSQTGMACIYSSPDMLWDADGLLAKPHLEQGLHAAAVLGASVLKMSIGGFSAASTNTLAALRSTLAQGTVELLIENDQTASAGTVHALQRFFSVARDGGLDLGMTFDMGNWHWVGECPLQASALFAEHVRYVHCKGVQRQPTRWVAVSLADSAAPWRAILRGMPRDVPHAIEYPLVGDDLLATTRNAVLQLRELENQL
jgi:sugar phosphate isomerase/epimerase